MDDKNQMTSYELEQKYNLKIIKFFTFVIIILITLTLIYYNLIHPSLRVYQNKKYGEAELARATSNRMIKIREAEAIKESSKFLADAEIVRSKGVAEANRIIGDSLKNNESYLRYLWVQGLQTNQMQTVYIPTEAGMPILEANPNIRK